MGNKIQITFKNHLISLKWLFFYILLSLIFLIYFYIEGGSDGLFILLIMALPQILPTIYVHLKFYFKNKSDICNIYENRFEITSSNIKNTYFVDDISKIVVYKSGNRDGITFLTFENYYYVKVFLKNGNSLTLTSLLDNRIEDKLKIIKGVTFSTIKGFASFSNW
jgi:hypothetical protein